MATWAWGLVVVVLALTLFLGLSAWIDGEDGC